VPLFINKNEKVYWMKGNGSMDEATLNSYLATVQDEDAQYLMREYIKTLSVVEIKTLAIAKAKLDTSFSIVKSNGFIQMLNKMYGKLAGKPANKLIASYCETLKAYKDIADLHKAVQNTPDFNITEYTGFIAWSSTKTSCP
jgi:predicted component of type VI protein secretion system